MLTIQYLEASPELTELDIPAVTYRLQAAREYLPISHLLIGWNLPQPLLEACWAESERLGMRLLRWQPLLTPDGDFQPDPSWQTEGLTGRKVPGYNNLPQFTFLCPNHPAAQEAVLKHLQDLTQQGIYHGFFLDRVRFPSPSALPVNDLACFCEHCHWKAAAEGLDLAEIRAEILRQVHKRLGCITFVKALLSAGKDPESSDHCRALGQFLAFRRRSVCDFLAMVAQPLRSAHMEVGLDCFSPSLVHMVGQDLNTMSARVDWVKIMTYAHTFAPAGLPYELSGLAHYLAAESPIDETQALDLVGKATQLSMPASFSSLMENGISSPALGQEVKRGIDACSKPVLAGIELVDLPGVRLNPAQIHADLVAIKLARPAGLALSWDLLRIPLERLEFVRRVYFEDP